MALKNGGKKKKQQQNKIKEGIITSTNIQELWKTTCLVIDLRVGAQRSTTEGNVLQAHSQQDFLPGSGGQMLNKYGQGQQINRGQEAYKSEENAVPMLGTWSQDFLQASKPSRKAGCQVRVLFVKAPSVLAQ